MEVAVKFFFVVCLLSLNGYQMPFCLGCTYFLPVCLPSLSPLNLNFEAKNVLLSISVSPFASITGS